MDNRELDHEIAKLLGTERWYTLDGERCSDDPFYSIDLNVIHDACQDQIQKHGTAWMVKFNRALYAILGHHDHVEDEAIHATARQRAEAFLEVAG
jgi:hypothetical protein